MSNYKLCRTWLVLCGAMMSCPVIPSLAAPVEASSDQSSELQEILVTAQKRTERLQDVPISISVLGGNDLDKSSFDGVTEALNTVPGIAAVASQVQTAGTFLEIRGVSASSTLAGGASTVGYYVDSVPFGMIRSATLPDMNVYDLQQVEVLRGPQGTLYGVNALNGVVRVLTNDPDLYNFDFKARGVLSTTEYGGANYDGDMAVNIPIIDGKLAARAVVGENNESGWINGPLGNHLNGGELGNVRFKVSAQPTDEFSVGLSAWHSQSNFDAAALADDDRQNGSLHPQQIRSQFNAYGVKLNYEFPALSVSSMTSYVDYSFFDTLDGSPLGLAETFNIAPNTSKVLSEEINLTSKLQGPWRWSLGAMYRDDKDTFHQTDVFYPEPATTVVFSNFTDRSKSQAVYGEVGQRFFHDELQWTLGLRYFHDDESTQANGPLPGFNVPLNAVSATSSATTPRAVLTWLPTRDLTTYVSYSQGFRSGIPQDELIGAVVQNLPPLEPDRLTNYEVGAKGAVLNQLLTYDVAVFYLKWRDIQQQLLVPIPGAPGTDVYALTNGGTASGHGAEFSLKTQPLDGLLLGASFSWNTLHFDRTIFSGGAVLFPEGARPNDSPKYTAGVSAQYGFPLGGAGTKGVLSASGNYVSALNTYTPTGAFNGNSLLLTRGAFTVQFPTHLAVALFVDNANNWQGTQEPAFIPQWDTRLRPRTYGVRFDYHLR
jgi:iron complex outermembrane receptor protein